MSIVFPPSTGYLGPTPSKTLPKAIVVDDEAQELHKVVVHRFKVIDIDDPDIYAAQSLWEWENSEAGQWVRQHAVETPKWHRNDDPMTFSAQYAITAVFKQKDYAMWILKFL